MPAPIPAPPLVDAAAGTPSLRTLGTGPNQAAAGNDSRFSGGGEDPRAQYGAAALKIPLSNESALIDPAWVPDASATVAGKITTGAQTISGAKTFTSALSLGGDLTIAGGLIAGGNVGIGASNPTEKLEVAGNIKTTGQILLPNTGKLFTGPWGLVLEHGDPTTSGTNLYLLPPAGTLEDNRSIQINSGSAGTTPRIQLGLQASSQRTYSNGFNQGAFLWSGSDSGGAALDLHICSNVHDGYTGIDPTKGLTVKVGGNVGIGTGTDALTEKFTVKGNSSVQGNVLATGNFQTSTNNAWFGMDAYNSANWNNSDGTAIFNAKGSLFLNIDSNNNDNEAQALYVTKNSHTTAGAKLFTVRENGNVGIGTDTPRHSLEVSAENGPVLGAFSAWSNTPTDHGSLYLLHGRGTRAAPARVQAGDDLGRLRFAGQYSSTVGEYTTGAYVGALAAETFSTYQNAGAHLVLATAPTGSNVVAERVRVSSAGNVGIGTDNPGEKLEVAGNVKASGYKSSDGSAGISGTFTVKGADGADYTMTFKNGLLTATTLPS